jgi:hypothetical protein
MSSIECFNYFKGYNDFSLEKCCSSFEIAIGIQHVNMKIICWLPKHIKMVFLNHVTAGDLER